TWDFEIKYPQWGRYLVRACDMNGEHCAGKTVYVDWPGWAGRAQEEGSGAASRLNLFSDKTAYVVGETAMVQLPEATEGRALLTVETGSEILSQQWVEFDKKRTQVGLEITPEMAPNAYVHVTLLQPHKDKANERPLRLYGIIPLEVADPATYLKPVIEAANEWKPQSTQKITVSEGNGKAMSYTLAVVDEGLLGLTNFKTPDLHREFYVKEALGIKTWDLFDSVIGAYNGKLERMLAIGGGDAEQNPDQSRKRRFPPVVKVMGPFELKAGETKIHEVTLPPYIGAVRAMIVAADEGAFGKADQEIFVRQPLIMQASMPKVLGTEETFDVPVTLFVTDDSIKQVTLDVETDALFEVVGDNSKTIDFAKIGEKLGFLTLKTRKRVGKARLKFTAKSGEHVSESEIFIDVRRPNQETTRVTTQSIDPGKTWVHDFKPYGLKGTNHASLELSAVPPLNLGRHLNYLLRYPHGCLEQTTSAAFPQLYLNQLMQLSDKRQQKIQSHIGAAVEGMRKFQSAQGEFNYWPGASSHNAWASVYAGHFLIEAKNAGYLVPPAMLSSWLTYQASAAQRWEQAEKNDSHTQAYRLYVLSLAKKPQMGAMNRLRESTNLNAKARWMLASAYHAVGQSDAASNVVSGLQPVVAATQERDETFSSHLGNLGIQLTNLVALDKKESASLLLEQIAEQLGKDEFQSTQGIAWALMGATRYLGSDKQFFTADYTMNSLTPTVIESDKPLFSSGLVATQSAALGVKNTSGLKLYASVISHGVPATGDEKQLAKGLSLSTYYEDNKKDSQLDWGSLPNGSKIAQGTDIKMTVRVKNDSTINAEYLALTIPVAAGWEILNDLEQPKSSAIYDHKDQRDDRIHYYFDLKKGEEKAFEVIANASYLGQFYVPAIGVEGMYDGNLQARERGKWVHIVKPEELVKEKTLVTKTIKSKRSKLYNGTSDDQVTKMFVIAGDKVTILKEEKGADGKLWYFIRFNGRKVVEKWIKAETAE
ncbi:MAG: alpha-2-macroglobulin family protein, partial [Leucothrix sp.]